MMKRSFTTAFLAAMMIIAPSKTYAQEENGFVEENFEGKGFQGFATHNYCVLGTIHAVPFAPQDLKSDFPRIMYPNFPPGLHTMYIGEIINAWKK